MAATNEPQPNHPLVAHLDPTFTGSGGHAPALAGWLEYLAHPEENTGPRVIEFKDGTAFESNHKPSPDTGHVLERPVLRDLTIERFFAHANVLSGQQVGTLTEYGELSDAQQLGTTFDLIEELRFKYRDTKTAPEHSADVWTELTTRLDAVIARENWDGGARDHARDRYIQLKQWYENHRLPALAEMNQFLVRYATIIMKARADVNELMGKAVSTLEKVTATDDIDGLSFAISLLAKALDLAINLPEEAKDVAIAVKDLVTTAFNAIPKSKKNTEFGFDTGDAKLGFYRFFESFIRAGDDVCWEAAGGVARLITDSKHGLLFVRRGWVPAPQWSQ